MQKVQLPDGRIARLTGDVAGRNSGIVFPDGTTTYWPTDKLKSVQETEEPQIGYMSAIERLRELREDIATVYQGKVPASLAGLVGELEEVAKQEIKIKWLGHD